MSGNHILPPEEVLIFVPCLCCYTGLGGQLNALASVVHAPQCSGGKEIDVPSMIQSVPLLLFRLCTLPLLLKEGK